MVDPYNFMKGTNISIINVFQVEIELEFEYCITIYEVF